MRREVGVSYRLNKTTAPLCRVPATEPAFIPDTHFLLPRTLGGRFTTQVVGSMLPNWETETKCPASAKFEISLPLCASVMPEQLRQMPSCY